MLHLFHGDNTEQSRNELLALRKKFKDQEIVFYDGKNMTLTDLKQSTESGSLFGSKRLVIVENLFTRKLAKKSSDRENENFKKFIHEIPSDVDIVFWEEKELSKTSLNILPKNTDIALFQIERILFKFLESIRPDVTQELIDKFNHCLEKESPEMIFAMLVRQIRYLIMVKDLGKNISELSPWQLGKFLKQVNFFSMRQLLKLYNRLLQIDIKIKTGNSAFNLTDEIRLFLINI